MILRTLAANVGSKSTTTQLDPENSHHDASAVEELQRRTIQAAGIFPAPVTRDPPPTSLGSAFQACLGFSSAFGVRKVSASKKLEQQKSIHPNSGERFFSTSQNPDI